MGCTLISYKEFIDAAYAAGIYFVGSSKQIQLKEKTVRSFIKNYYEVVDKIDYEYSYELRNISNIGDYYAENCNFQSLNIFLIDILKLNISFYQYVIKIQPLIEFDTSSEWDYYNNKSTDLIQTIDLRKLYEVLTEIGAI